MWLQSLCFLLGISCFYQLSLHPEISGNFRWYQLYSLYKYSRSQEIKYREDISKEKKNILDFMHGKIKPFSQYIIYFFQSTSLCHFPNFWCHYGEATSCAGSSVCRLRPSGEMVFLITGHILVPISMFLTSSSKMNRT